MKQRQWVFILLLVSSDSVYSRIAVDTLEQFLVAVQPAQQALAPSVQAQLLTALNDYKIIGVEQAVLADELQLSAQGKINLVNRSSEPRTMATFKDQLKTDDEVNIISWHTHFSSGFRAWRDRQSWYDRLIGDDWGEDESVRDIENLGY